MYVRQELTPAAQEAASGLLLLFLLGDFSSPQLLLLLAILDQALGVILLELLGQHHPCPRLAPEITLPLEQGRSHQALDLRRLFALARVAPNDKLAHVILLLEREQLADVRGALRTQAARPVVICEARNLLGALLRKHQAESCKVRADHAPSHGLALAAALAALAVARHALLEEQPNTVIAEDALLHGEALLVVASANAEDVALELIAQGIARNFGGHALVEEGQQLLVIVNLEHLLHARGWIGDIDLHP